jgi:hypothetical protein
MEYPGGEIHISSYKYILNNSNFELSCEIELQLVNRDIEL